MRPETPEAASLAKRPDGRWPARYRDTADGALAALRPQARRPALVDEVTTSVVSGQYVDPKAGRVTFETFYAEWAARQVLETNTVLAMTLAAAGVPFAQLPLAELRRSHFEQWVKQMTTHGLAPGTIRSRVNNVRAMLACRSATSTTCAGSCSCAGRCNGPRAGPSRSAPRSTAAGGP